MIRLPLRVRLRVRGERLIDRIAQRLIDRNQYDLAMWLWRLFRMV